MLGAISLAFLVRVLVLTSYAVEHDEQQIEQRQSGNRQAAFPVARLVLEPFYRMMVGVHYRTDCKEMRNRRAIRAQT